MINQVEVLNGQLNGNIKHYYKNGILKLEGEKNGIIKGYYDDGNLNYESEYFYGVLWNKKEYDRKKIL